VGLAAPGTAQHVAASIQKVGAKQDALLSTAPHQDQGGGSSKDGQGTVAAAPITTGPGLRLEGVPFAGQPAAAWKSFSWASKDDPGRPCCSGGISAAMHKGCPCQDKDRGVWLLCALEDGA
jgi:hypothetical protein